MAEPHTGAITFLFTDIEGFLSHRERNPKAMSEALSRHDEIFRTAIEAQNGHVFKTVGGAFYAAFSTALEALSAALDAQRGHFTPCRVGGDGSSAGQDGAAHRGSRGAGRGLLRSFAQQGGEAPLSAGHGGQVLLSLWPPRSWCE